jgi:hypothetical protein
LAQTGDRAPWPARSRREHFKKHGAKLGIYSEQEYDRSARETVRVGTPFTFQQEGKHRVGYYDRTTNRLTVLNEDETRILSHFPPGRGEQYVLDRPGSTYQP